MRILLIPVFLLFKYSMHWTLVLVQTFFPYWLNCFVCLLFRFILWCAYLFLLFANLLLIFMLLFVFQGRYLIVQCTYVDPYPVLVAFVLILLRAYFSIFLLYHYHRFASFASLVALFESWESLRTFLLFFGNFGEL